MIIFWVLDLANFQNILFVTFSPVKKLYRKYLLRKAAYLRNLTIQNKFPKGRYPLRWISIMLLCLYGIKILIFHDSLYVAASNQRLIRKIQSCHVYPLSKFNMVFRDVRRNITFLNVRVTNEIKKYFLVQWHAM